MASINESTLAVVLHQRAFRESSQILSLFTERDGRVDVTIRASRAMKTKNLSKPLPFTQFRVSWAGRGQLPYLSSCETQTGLSLQASSLYCGMYLNELLYRLLPKHIPEPSLYQQYWLALQKLALANCDIESCLRVFEWQLLASLGYGLSLHDTADGLPLAAERSYSYIPELGLVLGEAGVIVASGADFLSVADGQFRREAGCNMALAKQLMRYVLNRQLGGKPLLSRQLFQ